MIRRRKPILRGKPPQRTTRVKPKNPARKAKNFARAYDGEYANWIRAVGCVFGQSLECDGPIHAHHTKTGGMSRKADASSLVGLCAVHHDRWHTDGEWRGTYRLALIATAANLCKTFAHERKPDVPSKAIGLTPRGD